MEKIKFREVSRVNLRSSLNDDASATEEDDENVEEEGCSWSNLIFLPFHPFFRTIVLAAVTVKSVLGPIQSVFPIITCMDTMDHSLPLIAIKSFYTYFCDWIYCLDLLLHCLHRQVTDEARRREYLPKSLFAILVDVTAIMPLFRLVNSVPCPKPRFWPNILCYNEFLLHYRLIHHFRLVRSHSTWNIILGFLIVFALWVNCITCFLLLLTHEGLCENCRDKNKLNDWRTFLLYKLSFYDLTQNGFKLYFYAASLVQSFLTRRLYDHVKPNTLYGIIFCTLLMIASYLLVIIIIIPKVFGEALLRLRRTCEFVPHVQRILAETRRRNPNPRALRGVENFYSLMWKKRDGITYIPSLISELPRHLRLDIRQDLVWQVFYHSPTLRNTSSSFKRFICEFIRLDYKLPDEKFFSGPHAHTYMYYIKAGTVQLISTDDGSTPMLSLSGGTVFGDISFYVPPLNRKILVRCVTYCEIFFISRSYILKSMAKYPEDAKQMLENAKGRINHARTLNTCKQHVRGIDRTEDEGIAWIKKRWWEIADAVNTWRSQTIKKESRQCEIPQEETVYHCAKYIGQLVLCNNVQLNRKSMFVNDKFPWILKPDSTFSLFWHRIVVITVYGVLLIYPANISRYEIPDWFRYYHFWTNLVYSMDIGVSLLKAVETQGEVTATFSDVMFARFKRLDFFLDVLSTVWIEDIVHLMGKPELYHACQSNRLIKIYVLFSDEYKSANDLKNNPILRTIYKICLLHLSYSYIVGWMFTLMERLIPEMTTKYWMVEKQCHPSVPRLKCDHSLQDAIELSCARVFQMLFVEFPPLTMTDVYFMEILSLATFLLLNYCKAHILAAHYLRIKDVLEYQTFYSSVIKNFEFRKIHPDLLSRLKRYLYCHWMYFQGMDIVHPKMLKDEPYDIFWHVHGEIALKILKESRVFLNADTAMLRELAYKSKFIIIPNNTTLMIFGMQSKSVTWLYQGYVKEEYHDDKGEIQRTVISKGQMLSLSSVLFNTVALSTYTAHTDCELLYIKRKDFFNIVKRYPTESIFLNYCIQEFEPLMKRLLEDHVKKHKDYQIKLRKRVFHASASVTSQHNTETTSFFREMASLKNLWIDQESRYYRFWCIFRAAVVCLSITVSALQGGGGAFIRPQLMSVTIFCDVVAYIDIILKFFVAYYSEDGILVTSPRKRCLHYITRTFIFDVIGACPHMYDFKNRLPETFARIDTFLLIDTACKFAHIYIVVGLFNYLADRPSVNSIYFKMMKWNVLLFLLCIASTQFFINRCVVFTWNKQHALHNMTKTDFCWLPSYVQFDKNPTENQFYYLVAHSLCLAQCGLQRINLGIFSITSNNYMICVILLLLGLSFWHVLSLTITMLVLKKRRNTLFHHGVSQLSKFLVAERVDKDITNRTSAHFRYWWLRTNGINLQPIMSDRIGICFRQDLSHYFFKSTYAALDTMLLGGESLERELATISVQAYFMPGEMIIREMDLISSVFVIHRGTVTISQNSKTICVLSKGAIFGQLEGKKVRPVKISARCDSHVDVLQMSIPAFQDVLDDEIRQRIAENHTSSNDYMNLKNPVVDNARSTVIYLLRGRKTIKLPWKNKLIEAHSGSVFSFFLYITWVIAPLVGAFAVFYVLTMPIGARSIVAPILEIVDALHCLHLLSLFYLMELVVVDDKCVHKRIGIRILKTWSFYVDILSLFIPSVTLFTGNWWYQVARLARLHYLINFNSNFYRSFRSKATPAISKFVMVALIIHAITCGWMIVACSDSNAFPAYIPQTMRLTEAVDWVVPSVRGGKGCVKASIFMERNGTRHLHYMVPKNWQNDYFIALTYVVVIYTQTDMDISVPLTLSQTYYKLLMNTLLLVTEIWVMSMALSAVYTKVRELYQYDYNVSNLTHYLKQSGLSPVLLEMVGVYMDQLWQRQKGNWLPELAQQTPVCLREDILGALYMHHLEGLPMFRKMPNYFTRQLVTRLNRVVIFPGKSIVKGGDIFPCIFFIHEGEVEKSHTDSRGQKLMSLLAVGGYFGLIPGLFPNTPHPFTYVARTVVDLVLLKHKEWQDLLEGYPTLKEELYEEARVYRSKEH